LSSKPVNRRSCLGDQPRLERPLAITRHVNCQRPIIGQHGLTADPVAMIRRGVGFVAARRVAQVMGQLAAEGPLDDGFLEATDRRVELFRRERPLTNKLVEDLRRDRRERCVRR
jgi:hypothetical protein